MSNVSGIGDAYYWSVFKIAEAFGLHRDTVKKRLLAANTPVAATVRGNPVYALQHVGPALFSVKHEAADSVHDPSRTIVCDPSDMLVVQMTEDKAREHSKKRLDRTFRSSAAVKKRMSPRRNDNNVHDKTFRDGSFLKIGWPSVNIMSSSDY